MTWLYMALMLFTLLGPAIMSFEKKINFYSNWKRFFLSVTLPALFFIIWDVIFTARGIWSFNPEYFLGPKILGLPIEEWMFFVCVPFACVFIIENVFHLLKGREVNSTPVSLALIAVLLPVIVIFHDRIYTLTTFSLLAVTLIYFEFIEKAKWLGKFYIGWAICLIPFFIVNGILTGMPVVLYDNDQNMDFRLGTIPFEDGFYGMLLLLLVCGYYIRDRDEGEAGNEMFISERSKTNRSVGSLIRD